MRIMLWSAFLFGLTSVGCSSEDSGTGTPPTSGIEAGQADTQVTSEAGADGTTELLRPLPAPKDPGPGGFLVTASGEKLALQGYSFAAGTSLSADPAFVDGWEVKFDSVLVTLDNITLSEGPDTSPTDQSQVGGQVAHVDGPFAVDLRKGGPLPGKGGEGEQAVALAAIASQNDNGGASFDREVRYALGFDSVVASERAFNVNLDTQGLSNYKEAIEKGYSSFFIGTATYKGPAPDPSSEFTKLPKTVHFRFGFAIPTSYVNCQNPDNDPASPYANEEHQRGVQAKPNTSTTIQLTVHTDHIFWEKLAHEQPLHFDPVACAYVGQEEPTATLADMVGMDFTGFRCKDGVPLPPRSLVSDYTPMAGGILFFDPNGIKPLVSYKDFLDYSVSAQGHLNADGLCVVKRRYASAP